MSKYYNPQRTRGLYKPESKEPFKLSRSKIDLFLSCQRCFYFDRRLGTGRPPGYPFALNSAVDRLLKKEFDGYREAGKTHPIIEKYKIDAKPVSHQDLDDWRNNFKGVRHLHTPTNLLIFGAIDDLWQNSKGEYIVVDYKATSKGEAITELNQDWHDTYKRQMEIYQWLVRKNGLVVSDTGYFLYANGIADKEAFNKKLEFVTTLIAYKGNDDWMEETLVKIHKCLESNEIPEAHIDCDYCGYFEAIKSKQ